MLLSSCFICLTLKHRFNYTVIIYSKNGGRMKLYPTHIKKIMDFALALILIVMLSPLYLVLYILVRINMGSPVIFTQQRVGKNEKVFGMYKFRSMTDKRDANGELLPDEQRITSIGKILRKTSLDEIPQFFNILKGDMSFIGPRPLMDYELEYLTDKERKRHSVMPGISGLAQVSGRNMLSNEDKFAKDLEYVKTIGFFTDLKIALKTIPSLLFAKNITVINKTHLDLTRESQDESDEK